MKILLVRSRFLEKETLGNLFIIDSKNKVRFQCKTLELPYLDNTKNISCAPIGTYPIHLEMSPKFGMAWELKEVPGRSEIKIHNGNYYTQIKGCPLVGDYHMDINNDGVIDIRNSRSTRQRMEKVLADAGVTQTTITIINL